MNVLIADNSEDNALLFVQELRRAGYDITYRRVENEPELQDALKDRSWNLAIIKYSTPNLSGAAALGLLKQANPDLPAIIVLDAVDDSALMSIVKDNTRNYILKNDLKRLAAVVERELGAAKLVRQTPPDGQKITVPAPKTRRRIYFILSLVLVVGIGATLSLFFWLRAMKRQQLQHDFNTASRAGMWTIIEHMEQRKSGLLKFANTFYYTYNKKILKGDFTDFPKETGLFLAREPDIKKIMLVSRVTDDGRTKFESAMYYRDKARSQITEQNDKGLLAEAAERPEYFPIHVIEPIKENYDYLGFDLASQDAYREAIDQAVKTGEVLSTGRIPLTFGSGDRFGTALFSPVYETNSYTIEERLANLAGVVGIVIDISRMIETSPGKFNEEEINLYLYDGEADGRLLYYPGASQAGGGVPAPAAPPVIGPAALHFRQKFAMAGRQWTMLATPTPKFLAAHPDYLSWNILVLGLLTTGLAFAYFITSHRHRVHIEQLVTQRTSELSAEIAERKKAEASVQQSNLQLTQWANQVNLHSRELTLLSEMSEQLHACFSTEEAYRVVEQFAKQFFPNDSGALYIMNASKNFLESVVVWGGSSVEPLFTPDECWALRRGQANIVDASHAGTPCRHFSGSTAFGSYMCLPMVAHGETIGVLNIRHPKIFGEVEPTYPLKSKQRLAVTVTEHIALALANLRLHKILREQSIRDPLTGLFNRRYMEESLARDIHRAKRNKTAIGMIMIDIDNFKLFNDSFGHEAGDKILQDLGALIKSQIRDEDLACRYGGEEFLLILPETSPEIVRRRADDLRAKVQALKMDYNNKPLGPITISLGAALFPLNGDTAEAVIKSADDALYRAKRSGKNILTVSAVAD